MSSPITCGNMDLAIADRSRQIDELVVRQAEVFRQARRSIFYGRPGGGYHLRQR